MRRIVMGLSQEKLAERLGITFNKSKNMNAAKIGSAPGACFA
jgi:transcriptional regulator with XRE-family HTH domain